MSTPAVALWSGGKDCCMSLHETFRSDEFSVEALITTATESYDRISMHGVRRDLLVRQAKSLGIPLHTVEIPRNATNEEYESGMDEALAGYSARGIENVICGDIFLEDIREYRERMFRRSGMRGVYPVWERDTGEMVSEFVDLGYEARVVCLDPKRLDKSFSGRKIDDAFISDLPENVDPCGENGEFHTFVSGGPIFSHLVDLEVGETVNRDGFVFTDLIPRVPRR